CCSPYRAYNGACRSRATRMEASCRRPSVSMASRSRSGRATAHWAAAREARSVIVLTSRYLIARHYRLSSPESPRMDQSNASQPSRGAGLLLVAAIFALALNLRPAMAAVGPLLDLIEAATGMRSEEHTSELQSRENLVCRLLLEKKKRE